MIRQHPFAIAFAALLTSSALGAQASTDFSGRWTIVPDSAPTGRGGAVGSMGSGWSSPMTIVQNASRLTVEYAFFGRGDMQPPTRLAFALDGSETVNTVMMGRGIQDQKSRARWDGAVLVISTTYVIPDPAGGRTSLSVGVTQRLTLESPTSLVVETTREGVLGGRPSTTRTVYRKS
jgi:hypothetical protein